MNSLGGAHADAGRLRQDLLAIVALGNQPAGPDRDQAVGDASAAMASTVNSLSVPLDARADELLKLATDPIFHGRYGDDAEDLAIALRKAAGSLPAAADGADATLKKAAASAGELRLVVTKTIELTIPADVQARLPGMRTGQSVAFDEFGKSEYLDDADRAEVVQSLEDHAGLISGGWIDLADDRIYKLPTNAVSRTLRYLAPAIWLAIVVGGAVLAGVWIDNKKPLGTPSHMLIGLGLVLLGAVVHFFVNASTKQAQWLSGVPVTSDWASWWLLHPMQFGLLLLAPVATLVVLAVTNVDWHGQGIATYILAGYSSDSIARAAIGRLDELAQKVAQGLLPAKAPNTTQG